MTADDSIEDLLGHLIKCYIDKIVAVFDNVEYANLDFLLKGLSAVMLLVEKEKEYYMASHWDPSGCIHTRYSAAAEI